MEELFQLRNHLENQRYAEAIVLLGEMEEMSRDDKVNKIYSFTIILLLHLIKQSAENRTTRSWDASIYHAIDQIVRTNKRRKAGGTYVDEDTMRETIHDAYPLALKHAALEAFRGAYNEETLATKVDRTAIEQQAFDMIQTYSNPT